MITVDSVLNKTDAKVKTTKKYMYDKVKNKDGGVLFSQLSDVLLMAFAIGYRLNKTEPGTGTAFVNVSSIDPEIVEEYARLVLYRHQDLTSENDVWKKVQEYADAGIVELHNMMILQGKEFNIDNYFMERSLKTQGPYDRGLSSFITVAKRFSRF